MVLCLVVTGPDRPSRLHLLLPLTIVLLFVTSVFAASLESLYTGNEERDAAQDVLALEFGNDANIGSAESPVQDAYSLRVGTDTDLGTQAAAEEAPSLELEINSGTGIEKTAEGDAESSALGTGVDAQVKTWGIDDKGSYVNDFDATVCAKLHNQIMTIISNAPNQPKHTLRKFFDVYADQEDKLRRRLSNPLLDFLSQIYVTAPSDMSGSSVAWNWIRFTPLFAQPSPYRLWEYEEWELGDEYVLLYPDPEDSTGGIFFDMHQNLICMADLPGTDMDSCPWHYLELGLTRYLEQFEVGKFRLPVNRTKIDENDLRYEDYDFNIAVERVDGSDLMTALELYDSLLEVIAERLDGAKIYDDPLVDMETLTRWGVEGFAFEFLSRARRPSFTYIAPGITVFNSSTFDAMMELNNGTLQRWIQDRDMGDMAPILLFPGDTLVDLGGDDEREKYLFNLQHQYLINNMSGVYLQPDWDWGDTIRFVLPYSIGQNGHIRYASLPDKAVRGHSALYQHGPCPFFKGHGTRLFSLLYNWKESVRSGAFSVGPDGVEGGMDLYREADTEDPRINTNVGVCW